MENTRGRALTLTRIAPRGPLDHRAALATLEAHHVEGLDRVDAAASSLIRTVRHAGRPLRVEVRLAPGLVTVGTPSADPGTNAAIAARVTRWFDLDADLGPINAHLGAEPLLAAQVAERPGIRITRFAEPFEAVILTVLGQQVSLAAGRLFGSRLVAAYGELAPREAAPGEVTPGEAADETPLRMFPTPRALAARPLEELRATVGLTRSRARTVSEAAAFFVAREEADRAGEAGESATELPPREALGRLYGIGPWTLDYLAIRAGRDPDAFPASDAVLRRALSGLSAAESGAAIARWSPYRSYAALRLWAGAAAG